MSTETQPDPQPPLVLVGMSAAARCLGLSENGLRKRLARNSPGDLRPVGQMAEPQRTLFSKADVIAAVERQRKSDAT